MGVSRPHALTLAKTQPAHVPGAMNGAGRDAVEVEQTPASLDELVSYFREVVPLLLGGSEGELYDALSQPATTKLIDSFSTNASVPVLCIQRNCALQDEEQAGEAGQDVVKEEEEQQSPPYIVSTDVGFHNSKYGGVAFIKRASQLASPAEKEFQAQMRYFVFADGQPFASLYTFVQHFVNPFLSTCKGSAAAAAAPLGVPARPVPARRLPWRGATVAPRVPASRRGRLTLSLSRSRRQTLPSRRSMPATRWASRVRRRRWRTWRRR